MIRALCSWLMLVAVAGAAPAPLLSYRAQDLAAGDPQWKGSPGPGLRLPAEAMRYRDAVAFTGRGVTPLVSGLTTAAALGLPATSITMSAVFSVERKQEWCGVLGFLQDNGGREKGWMLGAHHQRFCVGLASAGADDGDGKMTYLDSATSWETGKLYHVAAAYDGAELRLYVNGRLEASTKAQHGAILYPERAALTLAGYRDSDENYPLVGRVALVSLYARASSDAEVAALFDPWKSAAAAPAAITCNLPRPARKTLASSAGARTESDVLLPIQQRLTPSGRQILLPKQRPQDIAVHPSGGYLVASGSSAEVVVIDPVTAEVVGRASMPAGDATKPPEAADHILAKDPRAQLSFHGLVFSPKGDRLYLSNVGGDIKVFTAGATGDVKPFFSIPLPRVEGLSRSQEIPAGLALSADGSRLYAALNLSDRLAEIETAAGAVLRTFDVGVAPYDVVVTGGKAYVSCWGGRRPGPDDLTGSAGRGTRVRVDPVHHAASEGSVAIVDLETGQVVKHLLTGLHACGLALSPDGRWLCVANANSDTVSVIDAARDEIAETIRLDWQPLGYFGASPNALCFSKDGRSLFVCNGTQNAVAVAAFSPPSSKLAGLIPVGWFPGAIALVPEKKLLAVANIKGIGSGGKAQLGGGASFNSHEHTGSISLVPLPARGDLAEGTARVLANCRREVLEAAALPPRPGQPPRPVPERAGEPTPIRHVIYVIKENRTYDQVLGDMPEGNGDPFLCTFGEEITPNQHRISRDFVLLDNLYCCGVLSADGHQWSTTGFVTDYVEKQFAGWPRSYPDLCGPDDHDALAYSPKGFIWDAVIAAGLAHRNFGESSAFNRARWRDAAREGKPGWLDHVANWERRGNEIVYETKPGIPSLIGHACTNTVGWETTIPDVARVERFLDEFREWEKTGEMPRLCIMALPADHTFGTAPGAPTPAATVADNDLAMGRLVEAVSRSRFWTNTVIFAVEDDPQNGWDHVSAYRTTAYVAGVHVRRGAVVSEHYSQNSILRTIELILGLKPMNQLDAIATPMTACFQQEPDPRPFAAVPNRVPLTQMNGQVSDLRHPQLRKDARVSSRLPLDKVDACPEDAFNRILWRAMRGPDEPYPEWAILPPGETGDEDDEG
jgi:YVTN family beta-propeller protein